MMTGEPIIEANDVCVEFDMPRKQLSLVVLWQFSLSLARGEFVSLVGPSGCGKTTFLNVCAGLLRPSAGAVKVNGKPVTGPGPERNVVFQEYGLLPWRTVEGNIRFGLELRGEKNGRVAEQIKSVVDMVGLRGFEHSYSYELSGGMRQRVGLARALVTDPELLLMDEPFGALDAMTREVLARELERIFMQTHKSTLFVTHSIDEAIALSDRIVVCTARPARIKAIVPVNLPRPRSDYDVKAHPDFGPLWEHVWTLLRNEIYEELSHEKREIE